MKKMLDLFSGLGGASEAFLNHGWEVVRIDNNQLLNQVPNTEIMEIQEFREKLSAMVDTYGPADDILLAWASIPCLEFSNGYNAPKIKARREGREFTPSLELAFEAKEIFEICKPKYWCVENVIGSIPYLTPIFGEPRQIIGSYVLYGNFPIMPDLIGWKPPKKNTMDKGPSNPLRANYRAIIPYEISDGLRRAIEEQKTLDFFGF